MATERIDAPTPTADASRLKVAMVVISGQYFGAEQVVRDLASHLSALVPGVVTLICNSEIAERYRDLTGVDVLDIGPLQLSAPLRVRGPAMLRAAARLRQTLRQSHFDIFHLHLEGSILLALLSGGLRRIPTMITLHGSEIRAYAEEQNWSYSLKRPAYSFAFSRAKMLVTPSTWQVADLSTRYRQKVVVVGHGVDRQRFRMTTPPRLSGPVLYVGRLIERKGADVALDAAKLLPDLDFWFVGDGELRDLVTGNNIRRFGFVEPSDVPTFYNEAMVCIFPSKWESYSCAGIEAMACGRPIVCTEKGFSEYAVDGVNALVIEPDPHELAHAISRLHGDTRLLESLSDEAMKTAMRRSWSIVAEQYIRLYLEMSESERGSAT